MSKVKFYSLPGDGTLAYSSGWTNDDCSVHQNAEAADSLDTAATTLAINSTVSYKSSGAEHWLYTFQRGFPYFDLSIIPSNAIILGVTLGAYVHAANRVIAIYDGQPALPSSSDTTPALQLTDFPLSSYAFLAQYPSLTPGQYNEISLPTDSITPGGLAKFLLQCSGECTGTGVPSYVTIYSGDAEEAKRLYLEVEWVVPVYASCAIEAQTGVTAQANKVADGAVAITSVATCSPTGHRVGEAIPVMASCAITVQTSVAARGQLTPIVTTLPSPPSGASVIVYNSDLERVAFLPKAFGIGIEERINELSRAWFQLPIDDEHVAECSMLRYVDIYDGDERQDLFRIVKKTTAGKDGKKYYRYECEHALSTLQDAKLASILYAGDEGTEEAVLSVLDQQASTHWQLGTCEFDKAYLYEWAPGTSLLKALFDIPERFKCDYQWTWDTSSHPWTLNLIEPPTEVTAYIDYGRNLKGIVKTEDATAEFFTRLYAYGAGAGLDQINISGVNPTGEEYIDADTLEQYGDPIVKRWTDQRYESAATLYAAAQEYLAARSVPLVNYTIDAVELHRLTNESIDKFVVGALVAAKEPDLGIDIEVRVVSKTKGDITGAPGDAKIELANKREEFQFTEHVESNDLSHLDIYNIPGGTPGALPEAPSGEGLRITTDYLGYYNDGWRSYFDNQGRLRLEGIGGDSGHFYWDPADGGRLDIKGTFYASGNMQFYDNGEWHYIYGTWGMYHSPSGGIDAPFIELSGGGQLLISGGTGGDHVLLLGYGNVTIWADTGGGGGDNYIDLIINADLLRLKEGIASAGDITGTPAGYFTVEVGGGIRKVQCYS
jgi:phage minor structural protein